MTGRQWQDLSLEHSGIGVTILTNWIRAIASHHPIRKQNWAFHVTRSDIPYCVSTYSDSQSFRYVKRNMWTYLDSRRNHLLFVETLVNSVWQLFLSVEDFRMWVIIVFPLISRFEIPLGKVNSKANFRQAQHNREKSHINLWTIRLMCAFAVTCIDNAQGSYLNHNLSPLYVYPEIYFGCSVPFKWSQI